MQTYPIRSSLIALAAALPLLGCGGGGGGGGSPPPPPPPAANRPPAITSPAAVNVAENSAGTVYQATASDPDNNPLTFSLAGGPDQSLFRITAGGELSFLSPPDFEAPADSDSNNVYSLRIGVSDGQTSATLDLNVTVANAGQDTFGVRRVGTGFASPLFVAPMPDNSGRVFVVEKGGRIRILNPATGAIASTPFLDIAGQVSTNGERGLLGFATAPDFGATGTFYVYLTNTAGNIELRRYRTLGNNRDRADPATADVILTIPHSNFTNHNGGWIGFGPDSFLYAAVGDGGGQGDPANNGQNTQVLLGKLLRIDVASDAFPADPAADYAIPPTNPFVSSGGRPEIWAYGLRNPFRNSFDTDGSLYIADVGENAVEEVDVMAPGEGGANFGWSQVEGTQQFKGAPQASFMPPVAQYFHGNGPLEGESITGGYVYRGPVESLRGLYFFADFVTGNIWSLPASMLVQGTTLASSAFTERRTSFAPDAGAIGNISSFGVDQEGNLYIVDFDGEIFRLEVAG